MSIAYVLGATLARLLEPIVVISALILGSRIRSKVILAITAVGIAILNTILFGILDPYPETIPWMSGLITGSLASLIWFFGVYWIAQYRRNRRGKEIDETFD